MDMTGFSVLHHLPEFAQTHVHRVNDATELMDGCQTFVIEVGGTKMRVALCYHYANVILPGHPVFYLTILPTLNHPKQETNFYYNKALKFTIVL